MRESVPQPLHGCAVGELARDFLADPALHVGVHLGEQEADRLQYGVESAAEGELGSGVLLPAVGGEVGFVIRAQREHTRCPVRGRFFARSGDVLVHRYLAYGG
ncbi:hypothetical protein AMK32_38325 [Streptomyces sp. CB01883]|nr:hypothetical protein AMK32_38325 [Streptomyces sp. CB01883]